MFRPRINMETRKELRKQFEMAPTIKISSDLEDIEFKRRASRMREEIRKNNEELERSYEEIMAILDQPLNV